MLEIPREEKNYKEIYPDLEVNESIAVQNTSISSMTEKTPKKHHAVDDISSTAEYTKHKVNFDNIDYNVDTHDFAFMKKFEIEVDVLLFELIIDRLEKEWYFLRHTIIKNNFVPFDTPESTCNICSFSDVSEINNLIYCDGCNLCVHQECYGVPIIPQGAWFCKPCRYRTGPLYCRFCTKIGGALKMTSGMKWGHVVCVIWNKDLYFGNEVFLEPIEETNSANCGRIKEKCCVCSAKKGLQICCSYFECKTKYHVTCAIEENFYMDDRNMFTYCPKHDPRHSSTYDGCLDSYPVVEKTPRIRNHVVLSRPLKSLLLCVRNMKPFPCTYFLDKLYCNDLCQKEVEKNTIVKIMKYWCKKKRIMNLEPLIPYLDLDVNGGIGWDWYNKRSLFCYGNKHEHLLNGYNLHQNMDNKKRRKIGNHQTTTDGVKTEQSASDMAAICNKQSDYVFKNTIVGCSHKKIKNVSKEDIVYMFDPLNKLKRIVGVLVEYSEIQLELIRNAKNICELLFKREKYMIKKIMDLLDRADYVIFKDPVTEDIAPNYFSVIKEPMDFSKIHAKSGQYPNIQHFFDDLTKIGKNCMIYNDGVPYYMNIAKLFLNEVEELRIQVSSNLTEKVIYDVKDILAGF